jgi:hypothetical protein
MKHEIFLFDGLGAAIHAFSAGILLVKYQPEIGMPYPILDYMSIIACCCAIYSLACFYLLKQTWRPFLLAIIAANLLYACFSIACVGYFWQNITTLGRVYFGLELLVIGLLLCWEWRLYREKISSN